jgi:hypothetical protein
MSGIEIAEFLERWQYVLFKVVQALIFVGVLWQLVDRHFHIREGLLKWATLVAQKNGKPTE